MIREARSLGSIVLGLFYEAPVQGVPDGLVHVAQVSSMGLKGLVLQDGKGPKAQHVEPYQQPHQAQGQARPVYVILRSEATKNLVFSCKNETLRFAQGDIVIY